ncbi:hypothetical protein HNV08_07770 [Winogradskyella eckloniae]|uniref:YiiX/YebB-like N1pC/P60 family cysteine hydrolase n=1 Tax=Winogradskyella eckloniae TaxID=1089306 RepID=UPI0015658A77|nr:YiiX/YebB-like N1pC/P60 family cysteine hydrolase [Winogradskyella eckloniae]NRD19941.1 hypothetical protein [Winogradskyella eckloniae]
MRTIIPILICLISLSCSKTTDQIQTGDIIFRGKLNSQLSAAINDVTQTNKSTNYTHMGICEVHKDSVIVYHSDLGKGVVAETLETFLTSSDTSNYSADVYRIKNREAKRIENAIVKAKSLIGNTYNTSYILEDEGYYCSEYIYELFKSDSIFDLEPMTFKDSKTNEFHNGWIEHYKTLGIEIPEGQLGCNPNGMANSNAIVFVKKIQ